MVRTLLLADGHSDGQHILTIRIPRRTPKDRKKKSDATTSWQKELAHQADPNKGRCFITGSTEPIDVAHIVAQATKSQLLTKLEYVWQKKYHQFHVDTRYNLIHLRSDWHHLFDHHRWMLIPELDVLRKLHDIYVIREHKSHDLNKLFRLMSSTYRYYVLPAPTLTNSISRVSGNDTEQHFRPPYIELGAIQSHVHPHFVVFNTGQKLYDHIHFHFRLQELLAQSMPLESAAESLRIIEELYTLWTQVNVPDRFKHPPSPSGPSHPSEQEHSSEPSEHWQDQPEQEPSSHSNSSHTARDSPSKRRRIDQTPPPSPSPGPSRAHNQGRQAVLLFTPADNTETDDSEEVTRKRRRVGTRSPPSSLGIGRRVWHDSHGRQFKVASSFTDDTDEEPLEEKVVGWIRGVHQWRMDVTPKRKGINDNIHNDSSDKQLAAYASEHVRTPPPSGWESWDTWEPVWRKHRAAQMFLARSH